MIFKVNYIIFGWDRKEVQHKVDEPEEISNFQAPDNQDQVPNDSTSNDVAGYEVCTPKNISKMNYLIMYGLSIIVQELWCAVSSLYNILLQAN